MPINDYLVNGFGYFGATTPNPYLDPRYLEQIGPTTKHVLVDKRTHRIRFTDESESYVTLVIELKETNATE